MATMKMFFKFLIIFLILYLVVDILTFAYLKVTYKDITDYKIVMSSPKIEVFETKTTNMNGYIKGKIINDTGKDIESIYIKAEFTSKKDNNLGAQGIHIENLKADEQREFEVKYKLSNVESFVVSTTNEPIPEEIPTEIKLTSLESQVFVITGILTAIYLIL